MKIRNQYAWFMPEIPFPFGPLKAVGLPGVVLEASIDRNAILRADNITISPSAASADDVALKSGGKEMTEEEYREMHRKIRESS